MKKHRILLWVLLISILISIYSIILPYKEYFHDNYVRVITSKTLKPWCMIVEMEDKNRDFVIIDYAYDYKPTGTQFRDNTEGVSYYGINAVAFRRYDLDKLDERISFINDSTRCWFCDKKRRKEALVYNIIAADNNFDLFRHEYPYKLFTGMQINKYSAYTLFMKLMKFKNAYFKSLNNKPERDALLNIYSHKSVTSRNYDSVKRLKSDKKIDNESYFYLKPDLLIKYDFIFDKKETKIINYKSHVVIVF